MLYQRIQKEHLRLQEQICELQKKIKTMPEGKLICAKGKNGFRWYRSDGHKKRYISRKHRTLAEQLAYKKYLLLLEKELKQERRALEFYLDHHSDLPGKAKQMLVDHPGFQELLASYMLPESEELRTWVQAPYERNMKYSEHLLHKTASGCLVRSKSEAMIALFLHTHQIPFRYECALHLGETTVYPDFTIRHPYTGKIYYWEHFGRMDDPSYAKKTSTKLQMYISNGIIPSIQLITTYETLDTPLDMEVVENILQQYFL